jgi:hypothetical protein
MYTLIKIRFVDPGECQLPPALSRFKLKTDGDGVQRALVKG